jgi:hypothetical protein
MGLKEGWCWEARKLRGLSLGQKNAKSDWLRCGMAKQSTLSRSTRLLLESGQLAADAVSNLVGARDLVLSRALCRYRFYRASAALTRAQTVKAARLFAEANAPFANSGTLLLRASGGVGVWYWDRAKLAAHEPVRDVSPESVWREAGDGWRIVACVEGYEAQYWEADALIASTWRRQPFSSAQWSAFALSVEEPAVAAPPEPPSPVALRLEDGSWRGKIVRPPLSWADAERAGMSVAICGVAVAALFAGQALHSAQIADREFGRAEAIEQTLREDRDVIRAMEHRRLLRDYAAATRRPQVLLAVAEAHEVLSRFGMRASTWRVSVDGVSLIVDAPIGEAPVREIVAAMEETQHLCGAVPEIAGAGRFEIRAAVGQAGAACEANGGARDR